MQFTNLPGINKTFYAYLNEKVNKNYDSIDQI